MWIKWKYNDHGWPDFKELEIPDNLDGYETVEEYLIERRDLGIPTWSERYMSGRVQWVKLKLSPQEIKRRKIADLESTIKYHTRQAREARKRLKALT